MRLARTNPHPYNVELLNHDVFKNWSTLAAQIFSAKKHELGEPFLLSKVRVVTFSKANDFAKVKYSMKKDAVYLTLKLRPPRQKQPSRLYAAAIPISKAKYQDLVKLCNLNILPKHLHGFYKQLPHTGEAPDTLPETDEDDNEEKIQN